MIERFPAGQLELQMKTFENEERPKLFRLKRQILTCPSLTGQTALTGYWTNQLAAPTGTCPGLTLY